MYHLITNITYHRLILVDAHFTSGVHILSVGNDSGERGVFIYWNSHPDVDFYYIWYKCDEREHFMHLSSSEQTLGVNVVGESGSLPVCRLSVTICVSAVWSLFTINV